MTRALLRLGALMLAAASAVVGILSPAYAAQTVYVTNVAMNTSPPTVHLNDGIVNHDVLMGMAQLTLTTGQIIAVNCLTPDVAISLGNYSSNPLAFSVTTLEDIIPGLAPAVGVRIAGLIQANSLSPSNNAIQGGIWDKISGSSVVSTSDPVLQAQVNAYYNSNLTTATSNITGLKSLNGVQSFGYYGTLPATPSVPEPASWAMMIVGFIFVGSMLRNTRPQRVQFAG